MVLGLDPRGLWSMFLSFIPSIRDFVSLNVYFLNVWNEERGINSLKRPQRIWKAKLVPDKDGCVRFPNRSNQSPLFLSWVVPWEPSKDLEKASGIAGTGLAHYHSGFSWKSMFPLCWRIPLPSCMVTTLWDSHGAGSILLSCQLYTFLISSTRHCWHSPRPASPLCFSFISPLRHWRFSNHTWNLDFLPWALAWTSNC